MSSFNHARERSEEKGSEMAKVQPAPLGKRPTRFIAPWVATAIVAMAAAGAAVYGTVPHTFTTGDTLQAADLNSTFAALDQRLAALEAAKSSIKVVMDVVNGPLPATTGKTATFTTTGGAVTLLVSGSGYNPVAANTMQLDVSVDGQVVGWLREYCGEVGTHRAFPSRAMAVPGLAAGSHTVAIVTGNTSTATDGNDWFSVSVIEIGH